MLEGVMMRSPRSFAMVCRRRSGELVVRERPIEDERKGVRALPLVRGIMALVESLRLGSEALRFSTAVLEQDFEEEERAEAAKNTAAEKLKDASKTVLSTLAAFSLPIVALAGMEPGGVTAAPAVPKEEGESRRLGQLLMVVFSLGLFVALPQAAANGVNKLLHLGLDIRSTGFQLITGMAKLTIIIGYLSLIRRIPDIRRVFQYHGAEHKTISTYEAEEELTVENARRKTTLHPRCGTTFLVMVAMMSVVVFSMISPFLPRIEGASGLVENLLLLAMKLPFIPVIAALTFELQRVFARYCTTGPLRALLWPGFLVQRITTIEPDDDQLEVAMAAMRATLYRETAPEASSKAATQQSYASYEDLIKAPSLGVPAVGLPASMLPFEKLESVQRRYREVENLLCTPVVLGDVRESRRLNEERAGLEPLMSALDQYKGASKDLEENKAALGDPELRGLAEAEIPTLEGRLADLERSITLLLLPSDPRDKRNVILEIRAGEGGEEAALFAADLFRMFSRYAETKRWKVEPMSMSEASAGGVKEVVVMVTGASVFSQLRFEGGVHRVQRVPATEAQGRIHTSTASVIVLPEADDVEIHIDEKDLEFNIAASGGPGGQGVNTTNSAVQIQHKPTGMIVKCQDERSQLKNKAKALKVLKSRLLDLEREKQDAAISAERRGMVSSTERSAKIRTYNYPQNRVTDHRIGLTLYKLDKVVEGDLDELVNALRTHHQAELLEREGLGAALRRPYGGDET